MATLVEMAKEMVVARAATTPVTAEEMMNDLEKFYMKLKKLEAGELEIEREKPEEAPSAGEPSLTIKEAFKKNEVRCMICGKGGFKMLTRHLTTAHDIKPREYRKQFGIPAKQSLSAKSYSETRKKMAQERGLGENLAKAREARMANIAAKKAAPAKGKGAKPKATARKPRAAKAEAAK